MIEIKKVVSYISIGLLSATLLTACNTMSGVGKDIESAGESLNSSAEKHKNY